MVKLSYSELESATNGFDKDLELGKGAFGNVYKARLPIIGAVAVKRIRTDVIEGDPVKQFKNEVHKCFFCYSLVSFIHRS